jgi:hypothetical protein
MHTSQSRLVREGRDARARRGPLRAHPAAAAAARVPGPCQGAPALQTMCDNVYMSVNVSVRLDDALAERLRMRARAAGESLSDRLRRYAEEGARRDEHPLITFRDGPTGRRAGLVGGPDVWEVSMWVEDLADEPVVAPPTRGRLPARGLRKVLEVMRIYPPAGVPERECPRVGDATTKHRAVGWPARGDARRLAAANDPAHRRAATAPRVAACTPSACRPARAGSAPTRGVSLRASGLALSPWMRACPCRAGRARTGRDPGAHAESDRPHVAPASADMREERRRRRVTCRARTSRHLVGRRWAGSHWRPLAC